MPRDRNTSAWLWVLGFLVLAALGFGAYLHHERSAPVELPGEAPSSLLLPFVDPVLAPLTTGDSGFSAETLSALQSRFRAEGAKLNADDADVFTSAAVIAQILEEAIQDRARHLERLANIGSDVRGTSPEAGRALSETQRKHMELAVDVSWQRNSTSYRNRIEELWARLLRLERGRFRLGSAPPSMISELPAANE